MLRTFINTLEKKGLYPKRKLKNPAIVNNTFDKELPFAVIRDDGKLIHQFMTINDASVFSNRLNKSYQDNSIKATSKVIRISEFHNTD